MTENGFGNVKLNGFAGNESAKVGLRLFESTNGSRDVWSSKNSDSLSADHLVVMVHGILGSSGDWKFAAEKLARKFPNKVIVHCSECNSSTLTLDGVDIMGERLADEVLEVLQSQPNLRKISFVAHSVGGLVARYAAGKLFKPSQTDKIAGLKPLNFITVATPHLGSRGNKQVPFLFGVPAFEKVASLFVHWIFRRTGKHLFLTDVENGETPLLKRMVVDEFEYHFMSALQAFQRRVAYANVGYDHIVGWRTSSIRRNNELPKWEDFIDKKYPHVVYEEFCKSIDEKGENITEDGSCLDVLEEELVKGLSHASWEKVDVSFHTSRQRFAAHSVIQVKDQMMHIEGADVVQHMIDHLLM